MKLSGNIVTPTKAFWGTISFDDKIVSIEDHGEIQKEKNWIFPGFIDLHVHGGGGADIMEGVQAIETMTSSHAIHGTTSLLVTTVTESQEKLKEVFQNIAKVMACQQEGQARILGVHLEGPYLDPKRMGAQPHFMRAFSLDEVLELHDIVPIRVITIAPESKVSEKDFIALEDKGIVIQLGHSDTDYEQAKKLLETQAKSVTHLFNAMSSFHHRSPGLVGAALAHAQSAELIPDLVHVHPGAIKAALRSIPDLYFVTDATAASGMPDGQYRLGPHAVHKCANGVHLSDGTLAGSSLTMDQALKNSLGLGLEPVECSKRLATIQSSLIGETYRGSLEVNKYADLNILNSQFELQEVYIEGKKR